MSFIFILTWMVPAMTGVLEQRHPATLSLFDGERALQAVAAQVEFGPRPAGSPAIRQTGDWILQTLGELGWQTSQDLHTLVLDGEEVTVRNLVASMGQGQVILLGAHYDTRLRADQDPDPQLRLEPVLGANDGGSGTAVLLELARVIAQHHPPLPGNEIRLLFFDAEDNGRIPPWNTVPSDGGNGWIIGSTLYAQQLDLTEQDIRFMILVDMVGDTNQRFSQEGYSRESAPQITRALWDLAGELGFREYFPLRFGGRIIDDHLPFVRRGIPSVDIIDLDYPQWHTSQDTLENVSAQSLQRVGRLLQEYLIRIKAVRGRRGLRDRPDKPIRPKKPEQP